MESDIIRSLLTEPGTNRSPEPWHYSYIGTLPSSKVQVEAGLHSVRIFRLASVSRDFRDQLAASVSWSPGADFEDTNLSRARVMENVSCAQAPRVTCIAKDRKLDPGNTLWKPQCFVEGCTLFNLSFSPLINPCIRDPTPFSTDFAHESGLVLVLPFYLSSHGPTHACLALGAAFLVSSFLHQMVPLNKARNFHRDSKDTVVPPG